MKPRAWSWQSREVIALFLFSMALLALELGYTKLLSVMLWYHFGFLMISTAMLGFAAAGVILAFVPDRESRFRLFSLINVAAVATVACYIVVLRTNVGAIGLRPDAESVLRLFRITILLVIPFVFIGLAVSWTISSRVERIGAVYGANLVGSAVGALLFILIFDHLPGEVAVFTVGGVMLVASALLIGSRRDAVVWALLAVLLLPLLFSGENFPVRPFRVKWMGTLRNHGDVVFSGWSSLSKVEIFRNPDQNLIRGIGLWSLSSRWKGPMLERMGVAIDGGALTTIPRYPQDLGIFDYLPSFFVHHLGREHRRSLHLGAGGGIDLLAAHHYGVPEVKGVEINQLLIDQVREGFDTWSGGIYSGGLEGVEIAIGEGRSFLERDPQKYDLLQLSGVDTSSSSQAGAFALAENYLYTLEAFRSYLAHLEPNGMLALFRWHMPDKRGRKTFSLRLTNLARQALLSMGRSPEGRILLFIDSPRGYGAFFGIKLEPFTDEEVARAEAFIERIGGVPMVIPGRRLGTVYEQFLYAEPAAYADLLAEYPYRVSAPTDDSPFYFELQRPSRVFREEKGMVGPLSLTGQETLLVVLIELLLLGALLLLLPMGLLSRMRQVKIPRWALAYFSLIGLAYIAIEVSMSQKLVLHLGHPSYALSVVLAGVLFFSGVGSFVSSRVRGSRDFWVVFALFAALVLFRVAATPILAASLQAPFAARVAISFALIAPLGFLMGLPMPLALARVPRETVPFLWGVNGFFSVVGSVLAVIVSINVGFGLTFAGAALCYLGAAVLLRRAATA